MAWFNSILDLFFKIRLYKNIIIKGLHIKNIVNVFESVFYWFSELRKYKLSSIIFFGALFIITEFLNAKP